MAFGNRRWLRVHHTKPSTLGWSVVVDLYKLMAQPFPKAMDNKIKDQFQRSQSVHYREVPLMPKEEQRYAQRALTDS